jgi:hypothetical protein
MTLRTVFDAGQQALPTGWTVSFVLACVGALLVFRPALMQEILPNGLQGRARTIFSWFFFLSTTAITILVFSSENTAYSATKVALATGNYNVVEGRVTNFDPMPYQGHKNESFDVNGQHFSYSDFIETAGFHNAASRGGPIRDGLYVRVSHIGNLILRLEVAD